MEWGSVPVLGYRRLETLLLGIGSGSSQGIRALGYKKSWQAGPEVPAPGSPPIELLPQVPGNGPQVHEVSEATAGIFCVEDRLMDGWMVEAIVTDSPQLNTHTGV